MSSVHYWYLANDTGLFTDLWRNIASDCSGIGYATYAIDSFESMSCFDNISVMPATAQQWATMQSSVRELLRTVVDADRPHPFAYITFTTFDDAHYTRFLRDAKLDDDGTGTTPVYFSTDASPVVTRSMRDLMQSQPATTACVFTWDDRVVYVLPRGFFEETPPPASVQSAIRRMRLSTGGGFPAASDVAFDWTANREHNRMDATFDLIAGRVNRFECALAPAAYQLWSTDPLVQVYWIWVEQDGANLPLPTSTIAPSPTSNRLVWDLFIPSQAFVSLSMKLLTRSGTIQPSAVFCSFGRIAPYVCFLPTAVSVVRDASGGGGDPMLRQAQRSVVRVLVSGGDVPRDVAMIRSVTMSDGSGTPVVASRAVWSDVPRVMQCWFQPATFGRMWLSVVLFSSSSPSPRTATLVAPAPLHVLPAPTPSNGGVLSSYVIADRAVQVDCPFDFASSDTFHSPATSIADWLSVSSDPSGCGSIVPDSIGFSDERTVSFRFRATRRPPASSELRFHMALDASTTRVFRLPSPAVVAFPTADELIVARDVTGQVAVGASVRCAITYPASMTHSASLRASIVIDDASGAPRTIACAVSVVAATAVTSTTRCAFDLVVPSPNGATGTLILAYGVERASYPGLVLLRASDVYVFPTTFSISSDALQCEQRSHATLTFDRPTILQSVHVVEVATARVFSQDASPIQQSERTWKCVLLPPVEGHVSVGVTVRSPDGTTRDLAPHPPRLVLPRPMAGGACISSLVDPVFWVVSGEAVRVQCPFVFRGGDANAFSAPSPADAFAMVRMDPSGVGEVGELAYAPGSAQRTIELSVRVRGPTPGTAIVFQMMMAQTVLSFAIPPERVFAFPPSVRLSVVGSRCVVGRPTTVVASTATVVPASTSLTATAVFSDASGAGTPSIWSSSDATQLRFDVTFPRKATYDATVQLRFGAYRATYRVASVVRSLQMVETPSRLHVAVPSTGLRQSQESPVSLELLGGDDASGMGIQLLAVDWACDDGRRVDAGVIWRTLAATSERSWTARCIPSITTSHSKRLAQLVVAFRAYGVVVELATTDGLAVARAPSCGDTIPPCVLSSTPNAPGYVLLRDQLVRVTFPFVFPDEDGFLADRARDNFASIAVDPSGACAIRDVEYESPALRRNVVCAMYTGALDPSSPSPSVDVTFVMRDLTTRYVFPIGAHRITSLPTRLLTTSWAPGLAVVGEPVSATSTIDPPDVAFSSVGVQWTDASSIVVSSSEVALGSQPHSMLSYRLGAVPSRQSYTACVTFRTGAYESRAYARLDASQIYQPPSDVVVTSGSPLRQFQRARLAIRLVGQSPLDDGSGVAIRAVSVCLQDDSGAIVCPATAPEVVIARSGTLQCVVIPRWPATRARVRVTMRIATPTAPSSDWTEWSVASQSALAITPAPTAGADITSSCVAPFLLARGFRCILRFPFEFTSADVADRFAAPSPTDHFTEIRVAPVRCGTIDASGVAYTSDARRGVAVPFTLSSDGETPTEGVVFRFTTVGGLSTTSFRAIAPSEIYTFPTSASARLAADVVTVGRTTQSTITLRGGGACVPSGGEYAIRVDPADDVALPSGNDRWVTVATNTSALSFPITPLRASCTNRARVTIRWGGMEQVLPWVPLFETAVLYTPPAIRANLSFVDASGMIGHAGDASVTTLVLGSSYGRAALPSNRGCGVGCTSILVVEMVTGGLNPRHVDVPPAGAVWASDASGVRFGTMGAYEYDRPSGALHVDAFTLGPGSPPAGGWVRFVVEFIGLDGAIDRAVSAPFRVVDGAMAAVAQTLGASPYALVFSRNSSLRVRLLTRTGATARAGTSIESTEASYGNIQAPGELVDTGIVRLPFTCDLVPPDRPITLTLTLAGTRTRVSMTLEPSAFFVRPTVLTCRLWFTGSNRVSTADGDVGVFALGATYGRDASGGFAPCGAGNASHLSLGVGDGGGGGGRAVATTSRALTDVSRVWAFDALTRQPYGAVDGWALDVPSQIITIRRFRLPTDALPACGTVRFGVEWTLPDGTSSTLSTANAVRVLSTPTAFGFRYIGRATTYVVSDNPNYPSPSSIELSTHHPWPIGASFPNGTSEPVAVADVACDSPALRVDLSGIAPLAGATSVVVLPLRVVAWPPDTVRVTVVLASSRVRLVASIAPSQIHAMPTAALATVSFGGVSGIAPADRSIATLALGAVYGVDASGATGAFSSPVCGAGNSSDVRLVLSGGSPPSDEFALDVSRVETLDASGGPYGSVGSFTFDRRTMSIDVRSLALPRSALPVGGGVRFSIALSAYGTRATVLSPLLGVMRVPDVAEIGRIGSSSYAVVDGQTVSVPFVLSGTSFATGSAVADAVDSIAGAGLTFGTMGNFTGASVFTVDATYSGTTGSVTATLVMARTRARVTCTFQGYKFTTYPTSFSLSTSVTSLIYENSPVQITLTGASANEAPISVYYSPVAGETLVSRLVQCGSSTTSALGTTAIVTIAIPYGTWYVYVRLTSPNGVPGPVLQHATPIVVLRPRESTTITSGTLAYNASRTLTLAFSDGSGNSAVLAGASVADAINYVKISQATAPIWATDSSGLSLVGARTVDTSGNVQTSTAWPDELGGALVAALPLDTSGVVLDVRGLAGGLSGALSVACSGTLALSPTVSRYYGRSVTFDGVNTSVQLSGLPPTCLQADWTIECWVYASSLVSSSSVFGVVDAAGNILLKTMLNHNNSVSVSAVDASGLLVRIASASSSSIGVGVWVHIAVVEYNGTMGLYLNGTLVQSTSATSALWLNTRPVASLTIGHNGLSLERFTGNMQDVRVYTTAKYTGNFSAAFTPMPDVALSNITRVGHTLQVPVAATSYRRARLFVSAKIANGVEVEMNTTTMPRAYVYPTGATTTPTSAFTGERKSVRIALTGGESGPTTVAVFASTSATDALPVCVCASASSDSAGVVVAPCVFPIAGPLFLFVRVTNPAGVVQASLISVAVSDTTDASSAAQPSFLLVPTTIAVAEYIEPASLSLATLGVYVANPVALDLTIPDAQAGSKRTLTVYYDAAAMAASPTQCGVGELYDNGTVSATCTFPTTGSFYIYARVTSPVSGAQGALIHALTPLSVSAAPGARWVKLANTYKTLGESGQCTYSADASTLTVASPACNGELQFADFVDRSFTGDFALIMRFTNSFKGYLHILSAPSASTVVLSTGITKIPWNYDHAPLKPYNELGGWYGDVGFAVMGSMATYTQLGGYTGWVPCQPGAPTLTAAQMYKASKSPLAASFIGNGTLAEGSVYYRIARTGTSLSVSISGDGATWHSSPQPSFSSISGTCGAFSTVSLPESEDVLIGFGMYSTPGLSSSFKSITLTCPFTFPSAAIVSPTSVFESCATTLEIRAQGYDTANSSTCDVFYQSVTGQPRVPLGTCTLRATGVATFQCTFPRAGTFTVSMRLTNSAGVQSGYINATPNVVVSPVALSLAVASPAYTLTDVSVTVTAVDRAPGGITILASSTESDPAPTVVAGRVAFSAGFTATATARFPSPGRWYLYTRLSSADGLVYGPITGRAVSAEVSDYALPTVESSSIPSLSGGVSSLCSLNLLGTTLAASNIAVELVGSVTATNVTYTPGTGAVGFTLTPTRGTWPLRIVISSPLANSAFSVSRSVGTFEVGGDAGFAYPTSAALTSAGVMVRHYQTTVTLALLDPAPTSGSARVWSAPTPDAPTPVLVGSYAISPTGTVSFPFSSATVGPVYFYVKSASLQGTEQSPYLVTGVATVREYTFPTSFSVASSTVLVEGACSGTTLPCTSMVSVDPMLITVAPYDTVAPATLTLSYGRVPRTTGSLVSSVGTLDTAGKASPKLNVASGGKYYLLARVTAPGGEYRDIACSSPITTLVSPLWPSTSTNTSGLFPYIGPEYSTWLQTNNSIFRSWVNSVYDTSMINMEVNNHGTYNYDLKAAHQSNMMYSTVLLLSSFHLYNSPIGAASSAPWWFRWGYKMPITARRYILAEDGWIPRGGNRPSKTLTSASVFTITGYQDSSFSSGTVIATITGSSMSLNDSRVWVTVNTPASYSHYEFRQTAGPPFATGTCMNLYLGN